MEIKFSTANSQKFTKELLAEIESEIIKRIAARFAGDPSISWLEAGGYVKWAKSSALIDVRAESYGSDIGLSK